jgi:four helix bundle protein
LKSNLKSNKEFAKEFEQRTKEFAVRIIKLASMLTKKPEGKVVCYQLVKSGTSIGANYREANRSVSSADFKNKISICTKEASETQYWLEVIIDAGLISIEKVDKLHKECSEILAIFTKILRTCKGGKF